MLCRGGGRADGGVDSTLMETATAAWHAAYHAAREGAALFPRPETGLVALTGPERLSYLNNLCTNKVVDLPAGQSARAFLLNPTKGRVLADFLACEAGDALWLECAAGCAPVVLEILRKFYFGQEIAFEDHSSGWAVLSLQGPESFVVLERTGAALPPDEPGAHVETGIDGHQSRVVRWSDTGETGFHLWVPADAADSVTAAVSEGGAIPGDPEAWTVLQIEAGVAAFGRELTDEIIPLEAPTEDAISHTKGCYPGQEVIARLHVRGRPAKHLKGLRIDGDAPFAPGTTLDADGKEGAGKVTASGMSPALGPIALAYVHRDYCETGTRLTEPGGHAAEVADLPMIPIRT